MRMDHNQWEPAALKRQDFVVNYGSEADIAHILATYGKPSAETATANAPK
jgi:16S rRNA C1402 N4-methylase RsmH